MRVLLVEDELRLARAVAHGLEAEGFSVDVVHDGREDLWRARETAYDAIVLDIMLPGINGYRVCSALRADGDWTPILMLTAKDGELDEAEALDTGADDFLTKPFSFVVLTARLRALLRRGAPERPAVLAAGDLKHRATIPRPHYRRGQRSSGRGGRRPSPGRRLGPDASRPRREQGRGSPHPGRRRRRPGGGCQRELPGPAPAALRGPEEHPGPPGPPPDDDLRPAHRPRRFPGPRAHRATSSPTCSSWPAATKDGRRRRRLNPSTSTSRAQRGDPGPGPGPGSPGHQPAVRRAGVGAGRAPRPDGPQHRGERRAPRCLHGHDRPQRARRPCGSPRRRRRALAGGAQGTPGRARGAATASSPSPAVKAQVAPARPEPAPRRPSSDGARSGAGPPPRAGP